MDKVTIKIPRKLYEKIQVVIDDSSFSSATDFIVYVLRDVVSEQLARREAPKPGAGEIPKQDVDELTTEEVAAIKQRLKNLGYL
jgi:Arc/MetJ-type ribon-helix-helix transcriptional regulator